MTTDDDIVLNRNLEEVAKRREVNRMNHLKRKEAGMTYPRYWKYQKKVSDITDDDRAKKLIEQKKKYIEDKYYKEKQSYLN